MLLSVLHGTVSKMVKNPTEVILIVPEWLHKKRYPKVRVLGTATMETPKGVEFNFEDESDASVEQKVKATVYIPVKTMMLLTQNFSNASLRELARSK